MKTKTLSKNFKSNCITYAMVIIAFIIVQIMEATGSLSSLLRGLLVPLCVYVILAVSLNLVVGISGELSLGHAGFMCIGAFASAFFSKAAMSSVANEGLRFFIAILIGAAAAAVFGILIGIPVLRLRGDYLAIVTLAKCKVVSKNSFTLFCIKSFFCSSVLLSSFKILCRDCVIAFLIFSSSVCCFNYCFCRCFLCSVHYCF